MSYIGRRCSETIVIRNIKDFDRQEDYQYIAKSLSDNKYHVGYIYVDKPWYSSEDKWTYRLRYRKYGSWGDAYWEEFVIDKDSIRPYTIRNKVWLNDMRDIDTIFVTKDYLLDSSEKNVLGTDIDEVMEKFK